MTRQITVLSGKGGTGKTSVTAAIASLVPAAILADCDVDGSDLHLVLNPVNHKSTTFIAGHAAVISYDACTYCGQCHTVCRYHAITQDAAQRPHVDPILCEGCGACTLVCPTRAITLAPCNCGEWMTSDTRLGRLVYARLRPAAENSGRLASVVRQAAAKEAEHAPETELILIDGPPGIGCPVIASMTGSDAILLVCEASKSGWHDAKRVIKLAAHFDIAIYLCINRWDLSPETTRDIIKQATDEGIAYLGRIAYDPTVTEAHASCQTLVEHGCAAATDIKQIWEKLWTHVK
jgi:MinD superfamily P-loop ATPase